MKMDLPSRRFQPRIYGLGAWTDNLHFAYDLVAMIKPRLLVELGTDRGESYFAFCQSVAENQTATRCFAVDTWLGDQQTGSYDETTFAEVDAHNRAHYAGFSTLLHATFDEALDQFAPESIDILHLDGFHGEAAVRHDLDAWLPKIAPGGIMLLHDVLVRLLDFGVGNVWGELRTRGRSYTFAIGPGLGVWQKPPVVHLPLLVEPLLAGPSVAQQNLAQYYRECARKVRAKIAQHWQDGTIRQTTVALQTTVQIFHSHDGTHSEENSVRARVGHETWKELSISLPRGAGAAPLRLDFLSALTVIDLSLIRLASEIGTHFVAQDAVSFDCITVAGDAQRRPDPAYLSVKITGEDPQLYLPAVDIPEKCSPLRLILRLRVSGEPPREK
jgi:hypothetical protein